MRKRLLSIFLLAAGICQAAGGNTTGAFHANPFIPGYFADPTIRKFGDIYYLYATTDGNGNGYGPAQVWVSYDFRAWRNITMDWPATEVVWAPDVMQAKDGRYHYFYCEPCMVHEGVGDSPIGPWKNILGGTDDVLVPDRFVHNAITLDPQTFTDDDGSTYLYFGTWGIYEGFGCGVARLNPDMKTFAEKKLIPNTEIKDFFEAPYVLKKDGTYYFMYSSGSCHDHTYRVQYATSTEGPMGPFKYQGCILETNADSTVHGPGHHSILQDGDDYYIVYHRHNIPRGIHGFHRQVCIDRLNFTADGRIEKVVPTHEGVMPRSLAGRKFPRNLAYQAATTASSYYSKDFRPSFATDDDNATLWKPATCTGKDYLQIDLGKSTKFDEVWTQFEYANYFYQYKIETSDDASHWVLYADNTANTQPASPSIDKGKARARYIRITVTGRQKNGHFGGIWNVKVYNGNAPKLPYASLLPSSSTLQKDVAPELFIERKKAGNIAVDITADDYAPGDLTAEIANRTGGKFKSEQPVGIELKDGRQAFHFTGSQLFRSDFALPATFQYSAPHTVSAWVLNPEVEPLECIACLMPVGNDLSTVELMNGSDPANGIVRHNGSFENSGARQITERAGKWQHWTITYDGYMERRYLDGQLVGEKNNMLLLRPQDYMQLGAAFDGSAPFDGYLHSLRIFDKPLTAEEVKTEYERPDESDVAYYYMADGEPYAGRIATNKTDVLDRIPATAKTVEIVYAENGVWHWTTRLPSHATYIHSIIAYHKARTADELKTDSTKAMTPVNIECRLTAKAIAPGLVSLEAEAQDGCSYRFGDGEEWTRQSSMILPTVKTYHAWIKDSHGNVARSKDVSPAKAEFECFTPANFQTYTGTKTIDAKAIVTDGAATLQSASGNFNANAEDNAILFGKDIAGDFLLTAELTQIDKPAYNEAGLMALDDTDLHNQQIVQLGIFPHYNCGNMLTTVSHHGMRPQQPRGNGNDWDKWMQIERRGNTFYARTSADGKTWRDMPGSPVEMNLTPTAKVGLFQTTYSDKKGSATLRNVTLYRRK